MSDLYTSITIRPAKTNLDIQKAIAIRWLGYKKYESFEKPHLEILDVGPNCTILLAEDADGEVLGTMRILDRRYGPIELESFLNVDELMPCSPNSVAEATRFSIPASSKSRLIKQLFWKAYLDFCFENSIVFMLVFVKDSGRKDCNFLHLTELENGGFTHEKLGNLPHFSYYLEIPKAPALYLERKQPLYNFFFELKLENITVK